MDSIALWLVAVIALFGWMRASRQNLRLELQHNEELLRIVARFEAEVTDLRDLQTQYREGAAVLINAYRSSLGMAPLPAWEAAARMEMAARPEPPIEITLLSEWPRAKPS